MPNTNFVLAYKNRKPEIGNRRVQKTSRQMKTKVEGEWLEGGKGEKPEKE